MTFPTLARTVLVYMLSIVAAPAIAEKVTPLMAKDLAGLADKEGMMLTVEYEPGASSKEHRHDGHVFVYVLEGSVVMQVEGGNPVTLEPGQTFYESPSDVHIVSKNASDSKAAKFLVFIVKDKDKPPVLPAK
jgi:quercetin dioxygenase-like cupin family protein